MYPNWHIELASRSPFLILFFDTHKCHSSKSKFHTRIFKSIRLVCWNCKEMTKGDNVWTRVSWCTRTWYKCEVLPGIFDWAQLTRANIQPSVWWFFLCYQLIMRLSSIHWLPTKLNLFQKRFIYQMLKIIWCVFGYMHRVFWNLLLNFFSKRKVF